MEKIESEFVKRHNLKIEEVRQIEIVKQKGRSKILEFPKRSIWNAEKIRKLCEKLFFQ
ncbi:hypothetical protein LEP1GSC132_3511 [Leptospira kirschneri str. 200803703]|uniref:Uncharacterized protein n=1 Tax=Leptospira kirschneri str. 200802841 TaxID=1193047 RepID=A0A828Y6U1_9LEPT|nr:hypothetical protein [Leptospira kirschneri]EJO68877.1 hypothetical protein LEP1GSC044_3283 [Leptospira kirschneri serovar Grippotyphosa str. RM52]EKP06057.1 hypothetical protein LEP1GSC018_2034 [Leptospira kirschneri str. 2008720114]EKQ85786.1 hypothetical protein LEP1GSC064_2592 [Leptospira kirschneri serovar Grippotyphosa str. Moskva]EKR08987.1 hypothetical protein LEP1GSC122_0709 [Leptospira kirschneri serovar Valbuzzi str. 200702274]EMJ96265.1 hypothetical protein LEP1GSC198_2160 [Lept